MIYNTLKGSTLIYWLLLLYKNFSMMNWLGLSKSWLTDSDWISRGRFLLRYTLPRNLSSGDNDTVYGRPWGRFGVRRVSNASWERRVGMEAAQARCGSILVVWLITGRGNLNELFKIFFILQKVFILDQIVRDFTHGFLRCVLIADVKIQNLFYSITEYQRQDPYIFVRTS